jgi:hypothetical protein
MLQLLPKAKIIMPQSTNTTSIKVPTPIHLPKKLSAQHQLATRTKTKMARTIRLMRYL